MGEVGWGSEWQLLPSLIGTMAGLWGTQGVQGGVHQEEACLNPLAQALTAPPYSRTQPP